MLKLYLLEQGMITKAYDAYNANTEPNGNFFATLKSVSISEIVKDFLDADTIRVDHNDGVNVFEYEGYTQIQSLNRMLNRTLIVMSKGDE